MKSSDKEDMLSVIMDLPKQCMIAYNSVQEIELPKGITKIVCCGMGGSGIPGNLLRTYMHDSNIPVFVVKDYNVPRYVDSHTLVFIVSYSGNTEETVSCYRFALRTGAHIVVISSNGKLREQAAKNNHTFVQVPSGLQPRNAVGYLFIPMVAMLQNASYIPRNNDIIEMIDVLRGVDLHPKAREIASKLVDKIPIVYASHRMMPVAMRWKHEFNEDSKIMAFFNEFPELNHNELVGYTKLEGQFFTIFLSDDEDHPRIRERMKLTREMISGKVGFTEVKMSGRNMLTKMFTAIMLGDLVSYYLALNYNIDPTPVCIIEQFKKKLDAVKTI